MDTTTDKTIITCNVCNRDFSGRKAARRHYTLEHETTTKLVCKVCYREYSSKSALERHHTNKHTTTVQAIKPDLNPYYTMEARLKAQNSYFDQKNTEQFRQIITSTGLVPSTSTAYECPEPPTKKRLSLVNTINNKDYKDLGLHLNAPALTPRHNQDRSFALEASLTDQRLTSVLQTLSKDLPLLTANDVMSVLGDIPTPVRDEKPPVNHPPGTIDTSSPTSSISSVNSSGSDTNSSTSTSTSSSSSDNNSPQYRTTSSMTIPTTTLSVQTSTDNPLLIDQETQTHTSYLSPGSILGTERYNIDYSVLRAVIYMFNELDSNLAVDFARMVNRNF